MVEREGVTERIGCVGEKKGVKERGRVREMEGRERERIGEGDGRV